MTIEIEGPAVRVEAFLRRLRSEAPPLARIDSIAVRETAALGEVGFRIVASEVLGRVSTGIPADAATCPDCLRELLDPADRRYRYPFLNCTNCGPRFTITRRIPYDRPQTSMARFRMCAACQAEYDDPGNRRFHAQPNACWECGPRVWLLQTAESEAIQGEEAVQQTLQLLAAGKIVAIKGIGGFHLSVDATNEAAVRRLKSVVSCHLMAGQYDYMLVARVAGMEDYGRLHQQELSRLPGVTRLETSFAMRDVLEGR